jgi:hypothetical protein
MTESEERTDGQIIFDALHEEHGEGPLKIKPSPIGKSIRRLSQKPLMNTPQRFSSKP